MYYHYLHVASLNGNRADVSATRKRSAEEQTAVDGGSSTKERRGSLSREQLSTWPYASSHLFCTYHCFHVTVVSNTRLRHVNVDLISEGWLSWTEHKLLLLSNLQVSTSSTEPRAAVNGGVNTKWWNLWTYNLSCNY